MVGFVAGPGGAGPETSGGATAERAVGSVRHLGVLLTTGKVAGTPRVG